MPPSNRCDHGHPITLLKITLYKEENQSGADFFLQLMNLDMQDRIRILWVWVDFKNLFHLYRELYINVQFTCYLLYQLVIPPMASRRAKKAGKRNRQADEESSQQDPAAHVQQSALCFKLLDQASQRNQTPLIYGKGNQPTSADLGQKKENKKQISIFSHLATCRKETKPIEYTRSKSQSESNEGRIVIPGAISSKGANKGKYLAAQIIEKIEGNQNAQNKTPALFQPSLQIKKQTLFPSLQYNNGNEHQLNTTQNNRIQSSYFMLPVPENQTNYCWNQPCPTDALQTQQNPHFSQNPIAFGQNFYFNNCQFSSPSMLNQAIQRIQQSLIQLFQISERRVQHSLQQQICETPMIDENYIDGLIEEDVKVLEYLTMLFKEGQLQDIYCNYQDFKKQVDDLEKETLEDEAICGKFEELEAQLWRQTQNNLLIMGDLQKQVDQFASTLDGYCAQLQALEPFPSPKYNISQQTDYPQEVSLLQQQIQQMYKEMHPQQVNQTKDSTQKQVVNWELQYIHQLLSEAEQTLNRVRMRTGL